MPDHVLRQTCAMLQQARTGCRVVTYGPLQGLLEQSRIAPVRPRSLPSGDLEPRPLLGDGLGGIMLEATWAPRCPGHAFGFFELEASAGAAAAAWELAASQGPIGPRCHADP